jgi:hypothetical protein
VGPAERGFVKRCHQITGLDVCHRITPPLTPSAPPRPAIFLSSPRNVPISGNVQPT